MATYQVAPKEVNRSVERMMKKFHSELHDAKVTIDCLFAHATRDQNGDSVGPSLKHQGYPANAIIKIIGLKDRTAGRKDAELLIDGDQWDLWSEDEQDALIDHELTHLELKTDAEGCVKRDDLDRPLLKIRKHDHQFGWFDCVARRHGEAAFEIRQWKEFDGKYRQLWLGFSDNPQPDEEPESDLASEVTREFQRKGILAQ
jgi:hypothetical protein